METNRCMIENLKQDDYVDVKLLYLDKNVREFLGGVISDERYSNSFKEILNFISRELTITNVISETQVANKASCNLLSNLGMVVIDKVYRFNAEQYIFSLKL